MNKFIYMIFISCFLFSKTITAQVFPSANIDYDTADIGGTVTVAAPGVLANDTDPNDDPLTVTHFYINGIEYIAGTTASFSDGNIVINADGSYEFTPNATQQDSGPIQIRYLISDGEYTDLSTLDFTVQKTTDLIEIDYITTCNQGYNVNNEYQIFYQIQISNTSTAKDYHENSLIKNINLTNDLDAIFGNSCTSAVVVDIDYNTPTDYVNNPYPEEFSQNALNQDYLDGNSDTMFTTNAIDNFTLYPRQSVTFVFCVNVDANCAGTNVDFDTVFNIDTDKGSDIVNLEITDFHKTEAIVTAALYLPESESFPEINANSTFDYTTTVIIKNEGTANATDINYNMGLSNFVTSLGNNFNELTVTQTSGPTVIPNTNFDGVTSTELLTTGNTLAAGETIILEVYALTEKAAYQGSILFNQVQPVSMTQGAADGIDESLSKDNLSFVSWSDNLGDHLDRYYLTSNATTPISSTSQCTCQSTSVNFDFSVASSTNKTITETVSEPDGIPEHEEITFQITIENTSPAIQFENLQLTENLNSICGSDNIISFTNPIIKNSTASTNPNLNSSFDGINITSIFDGTSGILLPDEIITVELTVLFNEDCVGVNEASFTYEDPLGNTYSGSSDTEDVNAFMDYDNDGIYNSIDIDDDNDTIPDVDEYNGLDPLGDDDNDFIPNYRDPNYGSDFNNDGIIDVFDFDNDGVPNHFDVDSDNDGIFDIIEANNHSSTDLNGMTSGSVGSNGLLNSVENSDSIFTSINYTIPNTDTTGNANFIDIDSDGDGIVDTIEGQNTFNYIAPNGIVSTNGLDTAYPDGIIPVDTENDGIYDYVDTNSDNDIRDDIIEAWDTNSDGIPETTAPTSFSDSDNDGLDDVYDSNNTTYTPSNNQSPDSFPNFDNTENPEKDWREIIAIVLLIDNISVDESENLEFTILLVTKNDNAIPIQSASDITIVFSTSDGTETSQEYFIAYSPFDYNQASNESLTINALDESTTFTVSSLEDIIYENDEQFSLIGTVSSNNTYTKEFTGIGTIINNDPAPSIEMNNSEAFEGEVLSHSIIISHPSSTPIIIDVETLDDRAISPDDYINASQTLSIEGTIDQSNANTEVSFEINTLTDNTNEAEEERLSVNGTVTSSNVNIDEINLTKAGLILDIDPNPFIEIVGDTIVEGKSISFTFTLLNTDFEPMFNAFPIDFNLQTFDDTTVVDEDYDELTTILTIPAYTSSITQKVTTIDDNLNEEIETLFLQAETDFPISNASPIIEASGSIKDNDIPNLFSPNGDGRSDTFKITGFEEFPDFKLTIFDRWGSEIYTYSNEGNTEPTWWDGTYNDKPAPVGVYFYTLDFNDNETQPKKNFIQLIR